MKFRWDIKIARLAAHIIGVWALVGAVPTYAVCPAANQYNFDFSTPAAATLAYGSTFNYTATSTTLGNANFSVGFTQNGVTSTTVGGEVRPNLSASHNGGGTTRALVVGGVLSARTADITTNTRVMVTTFTFPTPVRDISILMHDIDFGANQFRDWIHITGTNGALTYTPTLTTPFGQTNNTANLTNASSSLKLGPSATAPATTIQQAVGTGVSDNNSTTGNLNLSFAQPVTSVQIRYGNFPLQTGETVTGQQAFAISAVSWCPMPSLSLTKTSASFATGVTDPNRFNIPGSDVVYSLTITNGNTSPVDLNQTVLTDPLPSQLTFFNGDIDDGGPLTTNFEFIPGSSGLTLSAANLAYSNNAGTSFAYTPAAGYDAAVNAIRINPQGTLAANSSFTVRFRTRIK
jgi:uncharacterized repeat protein (TIGR01451 family)